MMHIEYYFLAVFIMIAFYSDVRKGTIPNWLNVAGVIVGFAIHGFQDGLSGLTGSAIGLAIGFGVLFILYKFGALGAGDVKLFAAIGALTGIEFVLYCLMYSIVYSGILGIIILLFRKEVIQRAGNIFRYLIGILIFRNKASVSVIKQQQNLKFPFMYAVLPGVVTAYYYFLG
jgi:prepilin peptidase CpaA